MRAILIFLALYSLVALILLFYCSVAHADALAIYRPHVIDTFHCEVVTPVGTPSTGDVHARCTSLDQAPDPEAIFASSFAPCVGGWRYRIVMGNRTLVGAGCYLLAFSATNVVLSCHEREP